MNPKHTLVLGTLIGLILAVASGGSGSVAASPAETVSAPDGCRRDYGADPAGLWFGQLVHRLCQRGSADALLSVYLLTLPPFNAQGEPDTRLLSRAFQLGTSSTTLLWTVALSEDCEPAGTVCQGFARSAAAARQLAHDDPDNAMAWLALAYAESRLTSVEAVNATLARAAHAPRVHDYTFDALKLAAAASGELSIPEAARRNGPGPVSPPEVTRWALIQTVPYLSVRLGVWVKEGCGVADLGVSPTERAAQCSAARAQFGRGDSLLTLSQNAEAAAALTAAMKQRRTGLSNADGAADVDYAQTIMPAIVESRSEKDLYTRLGARLSSTRGRP